MKKPVETENSTRRWHGVLWTMLGVLLLLPVPATLLSTQFNWSAGDFVVWGTLSLCWLVGSFL